jgi:subtilisin family serine protease
VDQPAWSEQFSPGSLRPAGGLPLPQPITREWAWGGATGRGVKVAVIDSGIDGSHPRVGGVQGGVALEYDPDASDGTRIDDGPHDDLFGHGTACAGIIRAIAPDCELYSVRVLGRRLTGKGLVFAAGLRWAVDHGMDVVNLSLSTGRRDYYAMFHELADAAYFANTMLVCAVNNVRTESYPSLFASVFSVAARPDSGASGFAYNPSPPVEFGAAGIEVDVAWLEGGSITATGNSFACPVMTGTIAKVLSKHPGLTPFQVKTVLQATADNAVPA